MREAAGRASIRITKHATERLKQRSNFKRRALESAANKAFDQGLPADATGLQRMASKPGDEIRVYQDCIWLFRFDGGDFHLVTVMNC